MKQFCENFMKEHTPVFICRADLSSASTSLNTRI